MGLVDRVVIPDTPVRVEYRLTQKGAELAPAFPRARGLGREVDRAAAAAGGRGGARNRSWSPARGADALPVVPLI